MTTETFVPGAAIEVAHPFIREKYSGPLDGGDFVSDHEAWRPGVRIEMVPPDDSIFVTDGIGAQSLTIVSTHKPGRFPERVFYTRQWIDPDGKSFGKNKLRMTTAQAFRALIKGYRHKFEMSDDYLSERPRAAIGKV